MILVAGATTDLGTAICRRLRDRGLAVRGLIGGTSNAQRVGYLSDLGITPVLGDPDDRASLERACCGVEAVIAAALLTRAGSAEETAHPVDLVETARLVEAARAADVRHFVYVSCPRRLAPRSRQATHERALERALIGSGLIYSILRCSLYMEVWLSPPAGFDYRGAAVTLPGPRDQRQSWISRGDVAAFAVAALENPAAHDAILELGGPEALSLSEVVRIFEQATGKHFAVQRVSERTLRDQLHQSSDPLQRRAALLLDCMTQDVGDMRPLLRTFPIRLLTVAEYARHVLLSESPDLAEPFHTHGPRHSPQAANSTSNSRRMPS